MTPRITDPIERSSVLRYIKTMADLWHIDECLAASEQEQQLARARAGVLEELANAIEQARGRRGKR